MENESKTDKQLRWLELLLKLTLLALVLLSLFAVFHSGLRASIRQYFQPPYRTVLATVSGDLFNDGTSVKVVKIKTNKGISLEIYGGGEPHAMPLIAEIPLRDHHDGYFHLRSQAANLAMVDVDGDNKLEIVAPSFDSNLVAHLNVFRYNSISERFELVAP